MIDSLNPQTIFDGAMFVIVVVAVVAQWQTSKTNQKSSDETTALTTIQIKDLAIDTLQKENTTIKLQVTKQGERIAVLEAENTKLQAIVANRNPELENFIRQMTASMLEVEKGIREILKAQNPGTVTINN
jgi:hypothetical protein